MLSVTDATGKVSTSFSDIALACRPTDVVADIRITDLGELWVDFVKACLEQDHTLPLKSYSCNRVDLVTKFFNKVAQALNNILLQLSRSIITPGLSISIPEGSAVSITTTTTAQLKSQLATAIIPYCRAITTYFGTYVIKDGGLDFQAIHNICTALSFDYLSSISNSRSLTPAGHLNLIKFIFNLYTTFKNCHGTPRESSELSIPVELNSFLEKIIATRTSFLMARGPLAGTTEETPASFNTREQHFYAKMASILNALNTTHPNFDYAQAITVIEYFNALFGQARIKRLGITDRYLWIFKITENCLISAKDFMRSTSAAVSFSLPEGLLSTLGKSVEFLIRKLNDARISNADENEHVQKACATIINFFFKLGPEATNSILDNLILFCSQPAQRETFRDPSSLLTLLNDDDLLLDELSVASSLKKTPSRFDFGLNILSKIDKKLINKTPTPSQKLLVKALIELVVIYNLQIRKHLITDIKNEARLRAARTPPLSISNLEIINYYIEHITPVQNRSLTLIGLVFELAEDKIQRILDHLLYCSSIDKIYEIISEELRVHGIENTTTQNPSALDIKMRSAPALSLNTVIPFLSPRIPFSYDAPILSSDTGSTTAADVSPRGVELTRRPSLNIVPTDSIKIEDMIFAIKIIRLIFLASIKPFLSQLKSRESNQYRLFLEAYLYQQREYFLRMPYHSQIYERALAKPKGASAPTPSSQVYYYGRRLHKLLNMLCSGGVIISDILGFIFEHCAEHPVLDPALVKLHGTEIAKFQYLLSIFAKIFLPETLVTKGLITEAEYDFYKLILNHFHLLLSSEAPCAVIPPYAQISESMRDVIALLVTDPEILGLLKTLVESFTGQTLPTLDAIITASNQKLSPLYIPSTVTADAPTDAAPAATPLLPANTTSAAHSRITNRKQLLPTTATNHLTLSFADRTDTFTMTLNSTGLIGQLVPTHEVLIAIFDLCALNTVSLPNHERLADILLEKIQPLLLGIDTNGSLDIFNIIEAYLNYLLSHHDACLQWYREYAETRSLIFSTNHDGPRLISTLGEIKKDVRKKARDLTNFSARNAVWFLYNAIRFGIPAAFLTFFGLFIDRLIVNPDENNPYSRDTLYTNYTLTFLTGAATQFFLFTPNLYHAIFERLRPSQITPPSWSPFILLNALTEIPALITLGGYIACQILADNIASIPHPSSEDQVRLYDIIVAGLSLLLSTLFLFGASLSALASTLFVLHGTGRVRCLAPRPVLDDVLRSERDRAIILSPTATETPDPFTNIGKTLDSVPASTVVNIAAGGSSGAGAGAGAGADNNSLALVVYDRDAAARPRSSITTTTAHALISLP